MEKKTLFTIKQTAEYFGVPKFFVRHLAEDGKIVCFRSGNRWLIHADKFAEFLEKGVKQ